MNPRYRLRAALALGCVLLAGAGVWGLWPSGPRDVVYAVRDDGPLTLDLDFPAGLRPPPPLIVLVPPAGDWTREMKLDPRYRAVRDRLTGHGYAVATVRYRPAGPHRFPAQIEDVKAAVRWLRANADRYGLSPDRIGAVGLSAGGYGACMLGTTGPGDGFDGPDNAGRSARVQAVVGLGVPGDLVVPVWPDRLEHVYLQPFLGAGHSENPSLYARASPGAYAGADDPPFLLFHSRGDILVPIEMARTFANRLRRAGVAVTLVEEDGVEHAWTGARLDRALDRALPFLDQHLRPQGPIPSQN